MCRRFALDDTIEGVAANAMAALLGRFTDANLYKQHEADQELERVRDEQEHEQEFTGIYETILKPTSRLHAEF